jgi:hypothetical protein
VADDVSRPPLVSLATSTLFLTWDGTAVRINLQGTYVHITLSNRGAEGLADTLCQRLSSTADREILHLLQLQSRREPHYHHIIFQIENLLILASGLSLPFSASSN